MQVRFPVILTAEEKEIARKIVLAFGQVRYGRERGDVGEREGRSRGDRGEM